MLLPETHRSSMPFIASLALQFSIVLLVAIPWTVATLGNQFIQAPAMLVFQALKAVEPPPPATHLQEATSNQFASTVPGRRVFEAPRKVSNLPSPASLEAPPEIGSDAGTIFAIGDATQGGDVLAHLGSAPFVPPDAPHLPEVLKQVVVCGKVQAAKLVHQVQPAYPPLAKQARIQGVVILEAIIGTDGAIQQLSVVSGSPMLLQNAIDAVRQWKYTPTVLNERAVEVKTTIEVRFTLSER